MASPRLTPVVVNAPQRSTDWFAARLGRVTGSKVDVTMSYAQPTQAQMKQALEIYREFDIDEAYIAEMSSEFPWKFVQDVGIDIAESAARANYRKTKVGERLTGQGADDDEFVSKATQWGTVSEPTARAMYQLKSQSIVEEAPLMLHPSLKCGASPDGLVVDPDTGLLGNIEIKCLTTANHLYEIIRNHKVPAKYIPQIQMQLWITGRDFCDFVGFDSRLPDGLQIFIERVERDDYYIDEILAPAVKKFLDECDKEFNQFWAEVTEKGQAIARLTSPEFAK